MRQTERQFRQTDRKKERQRETVTYLKKITFIKAGNTKAGISLERIGQNRRHLTDRVVLGFFLAFHWCG